MKSASPVLESVTEDNLFVSNLIQILYFTVFWPFILSSLLSPYIPDNSGSKMEIFIQIYHQLKKHTYLCSFKKYTEKTSYIS